MIAFVTEHYYSNSLLFKCNLMTLAQCQKRGFPSPTNTFFKHVFFIDKNRKSEYRCFKKKKKREQKGKRRKKKKHNTQIHRNGKKKKKIEKKSKNRMYAGIARE